MRWSCILALAALAFLGITGTRAAASAYQSSPAADLLSGRAVWKDLPKPFLQALGGKLVTAPVAKEFAVLCETTEILKKQVVKFVAGDDPAFSLGSIAITLTSYGNQMGADGHYAKAKRAYEFALLLRPAHTPAMSSMAITAMLLRDCATARTFAGKVLSSKPNPDSNDSFDRGLADAMKDPSWRDIVEQMKEIQRICAK